MVRRRHVKRLRSHKQRALTAQPPCCPAPADIPRGSCQQGYLSLISKRSHELFGTYCCLLC